MAKEIVLLFQDGRIILSLKIMKSMMRDGKSTTEKGL